MFRKAIFWLHLSAGAVAGLVILTMAATGVLLAFERQMTRWADGTVRCEPVGARLSVGKLLAAHVSDKPTSATIRADPTAPVTIGFGKERAVLVDPYTGNVVGEGSTKVREVFHTVTDLHRWLGAKPARPVTGAANLAFGFLVLSGLVIWWRGGMLWFKSALTGKARDWNWHHVIGFWSALPLLVIVLTGAVMSYPWANNLLFRLAGNESPPPRAARVDGQLTVTVDEGIGLARRSRWTINAATGEVVRRESYADQNAGRKARSWVRFIHTGEAAGWLGQTIAMLASAGAVVLVWTGLALAWRRFWAWRRGTVPVVVMSHASNI